MKTKKLALFDVEVDDKAVTKEMPVRISSDYDVVAYLLRGFNYKELTLMQTGLTFDQRPYRFATVDGFKEITRGTKEYCLKLCEYIRSSFEGEEYEMYSTAELLRDINLALVTLEVEKGFDRVKVSYGSPKGTENINYGKITSVEHVNGASLLQVRLVGKLFNLEVSKTTEIKVSGLVDIFKLGK